MKIAGIGRGLIAAAVLVSTQAGAEPLRPPNDEVLDPYADTTSEILDPYAPGNEARASDPGASEILDPYPAPPMHRAPPKRPRR